jgi:putative ubiquitin-RnfH superfamily antitoxin RatB of RatAB toxin-antitoxin module
MAIDSDLPKQSVEVAYATPERQLIVQVEVPSGCTVAEAIERSAIVEQFPELVIAPDRVGIFSRKVALDHVVQSGDRVEIYRPLIADPKETRRKRAARPDSE